MSKLPKIDVSVTDGPVWVSFDELEVGDQFKLYHGDRTHVYLGNYEFASPAKGGKTSISSLKNYDSNRCMLLGKTEERVTVTMSSETLMLLGSFESFAENIDAREALLTEYHKAKNS